MNGARILVVDDEELIRWSLAERMRADGHDVIEAATGNEALEKARDGVDLVLLDYKLPDVDGVAAVHELPLDLGEVHGERFHRLATGAATDADFGEHHVVEGVDDERQHLAVTLGGVAPDQDFHFRQGFAGAAVFVEGGGGAVDELGDGEFADVRLARSPF